MAIVKAAVSVTVVGPRPSYSDSKNNRISPTMIASSAFIRHLTEIFHCKIQAQFLGLQLYQLRDFVNN